MERLTVDTKLTFCDIANCNETPGGSFCENGYCDQRRVYERLREYERDEQSGAIVRMPVPVGTVVFTVSSCRCGLFYADRCRDSTKTPRRTAECYPVESQTAYAKCWKLYARAFDPIKHIHLLEKTVFTHKEQALNYIRGHGGVV